MELLKKLIRFPFLLELVLTVLACPALARVTAEVFNAAVKSGSWSLIALALVWSVLVWYAVARWVKCIIRLVRTRARCGGSTN